MRQSLVLGGLAVALIACGGDEPEPTPPNTELSDGERIFSNPVEGGNTFTCSTCHATTEPAEDGFRRPGHTLAGSAQRSTYKNGALTEMLDAVNSCRVEWMNADPWTDDNADWLELFEFLDGLSGDATPVEIDIVEPPTSLSGGSADAGRETFNASCAVCHAREGVGTQLAPPVAMRGLAADLIARRVRTSGRIDSEVYDGLTGGVMPFWASDRLSDDELRDIIAWIESTGDPVAGGGDGGPSSDLRGCGVTHPMVGSTAQLQANSHNVGGTATIVDDCTIEITGFNFDGEGIDVQMYGGFEGMYENGFSMSENLVRPEPYLGGTIRFTLPDGFTMDDVGGVSVWCVPVGADFGSGTFG